MPADAARLRTACAIARPIRKRWRTAARFSTSRSRSLRRACILALGAPAAKSFLGRDFQITKMRGRWYAGPRDIPLMVTFHPAYILRQTGGEIEAVKRLVWPDLKAVRGKLDEPAAPRGAGRTRSRRTLRRSDRESRSDGDLVGRSRPRARALPSVNEFAATFRSETVSLAPALSRRHQRTARAVDAVTTLPKELRTALVARGVAFSTLESLGRSALEGRANDQRPLSPARRQRSRGGAHGALRRSHDASASPRKPAAPLRARSARPVRPASTGTLAPWKSSTRRCFFARELAARGKRITNVVFMGMGEPFHNYEAVMDAVALAQRSATGSAWGIGTSRSRRSGWSTRSTASPTSSCKSILAISLHAPNDALRSQLMPVNRRFRRPGADGRVRALRRRDAIARSSSST